MYSKKIFLSSVFVPQKHRAPFKRSLTCQTHIESKTKSVVGEIRGGGLGVLGKFFWGGYLRLVENRGGGIPYFRVILFFKIKFLKYYLLPPPNVHPWLSQNRTQYIELFWVTFCQIMSKEVFVFKAFLKQNMKGALFILNILGS